MLELYIVSLILIMVSYILERQYKQIILEGLQVTKVMQKLKEISTFIEHLTNMGGNLS